MRTHDGILPLTLAVVCAALGYSQPTTLTILHTNDMHAAFVPHEALWVRGESKPLVGGFKELSFAVDSIRKRNSPVLLLDAGDVMTGNPITELAYGGAQGGALFEMMNRIGYDAWCPGNHDFDISQANLVLLTAMAKFPTLSANLVNEKNQYPVGNRPRMVFEKNGLTIGVIGVMSQELYGLVNQNNLVGIRVLSPVETTQKWVNQLRGKTQVLIALTHEGFDEDSVLAAKTRGLDVIIGGHSHTRLKKPRVVNGVLIVQTGSNCENLGVLNLTIDSGRIVSYDGSLLPLWYRADRPSTPLSEFVDSVQHEIDRDYSEVLATLKLDWVRGQGESSIGNFITDAQREAAGAEVGFMNTHGIRTNVPAGPLTKRRLFEVLPFRNVLTTFQLSGAQLRDAMRHSLARGTGILTSGISCRWKKSAGRDIEILSLEVNGKPVEDERMYRCAASDFLVGEAKRYLGIEILQPIFLKQTVFEAVEKEVRKAGVIAPALERRVIEVK